MGDSINTKLLFIKIKSFKHIHVFFIDSGYEISQIKTQYLIESVTLNDTKIYNFNNCLGHTILHKKIKKYQIIL